MNLNDGTFQSSINQVSEVIRAIFLAPLLSFSYISNIVCICTPGASNGRSDDEESAGTDAAGTDECAS